METNNHEWLDRTEYPFESKFFQVNGTRMHYVDEGKGNTVLFIHGNPSWSFDSRKLIKGLSGNFRCIAIDHIGFGLSAKPVYYDYSTGNHAKTLEAFIDFLGLENITLVMHDFGGPIGFDYAIKNPDKISRLIVMNSWLWDSSSDDSFKKIRNLLGNPLIPLMNRYLNFYSRYMLPASFGGYKLSGHLLDHYAKPFKKITERNGPMSFGRSLLNDQHWFQELWNNRGVLKKKPVLFIWGMNDRFLDAAYLDKFIAGFTNSYVKKLDTCGHFPQEECVPEVLSSIRYFLAKNDHNS